QDRAKQVAEETKAVLESKEVVDASLIPLKLKINPQLLWGKSPQEQQEVIDDVNAALLKNQDLIQKRNDIMQRAAAIREEGTEKAQEQARALDAEAAGLLKQIHASDAIQKAIGSSLTDDVDHARAGERAAEQHANLIKKLRADAEGAYAAMA